MAGSGSDVKKFTGVDELGFYTHMKDFDHSINMEEEGGGGGGGGGEGGEGEGEEEEEEEEEEELVILNFVNLWK